MGDHYKKLNSTLAAGGASLICALLSGTVSAGTIIGSAHDFSNRGWSPDDQICVACHTPHNADISVTDAPLWNHEVTTKVFDLYDSPTFDGSATITQPTGSSVLCLSCHDGTVAIDSFGGTSGSVFMQGKNAIGADELTNDHPISFTYDAALAETDGALWDPESTEVTVGSGDKTKTGLISEVMLANNQLQCSSCHDVHNNFVADDPLLMVTKTESSICITCHDK